MKVFFALIFCLFSTAVAAQGNITGKWKTIDDETGEAKSVVEIYEKDGKYYGKIIKLYRKPGEDPDPLCVECPKDDPRYNEKIIGMEIMKDLVKDGNEYVNGTVLKPDEGTIYRCKVWLEDNKLMVRGYWGFLYRTQQWERI
ncbi:MAG: DUF2147 domain-containing protein [Candidatus Cyclobacteriaceae bacterium M2_1C_046]